MERPTVRSFGEVRRGLPVLAAALFVAALLFPMWHISVDAAQYPSTTLHLELYAYPHLTGDYTEMARLNHYIGFYYPDPVFVEPNYPVQEGAIRVPEWSLGPVAFVAVSLLSAFVAVAPTAEKLERGLTYQLVGTVAVFGVMLVDIQYRLWQAGHSLDPDAPVMGVSGFTPPLWGRYEVANITSVSRFGLGAYMAMAAVAMLAVAFYYRDEDVTFGDLLGRTRRAAGGDDTGGDEREDAGAPAEGSTVGRADGARTNRTDEGEIGAER